MKKLLHERLRDGEGAFITFEVGSYGFSYHRDIAEAFADEIERYYIPRLRFEDGEPVQWLDQIEIYCYDKLLGKGTMQSFHPNKGSVWIISLVDLNHEQLVRYDPVTCVIKRLCPKVLDHDGVEIKVGENRYSIRTGEYLVVNKVGAERCLCTVLGDGCTLGTCGYKPSELSNKEPDSLEKLYHDMMEHHENWNSDPNEWVEMATRLSALIEKVE